MRRLGGQIRVRGGVGRADRAKEGLQVDAFAAEPGAEHRRLLGERRRVRREDEELLMLICALPEEA